MTPEQIEAVQNCFAKVVSISDEAAGIFYGRLLNTTPEARKLFRGDMDEQGRKLMTILTTVVGNLNTLEAVIPAAQKLAVRHVEYGVTADQYDKAGEALLWPLGQGLGDAFDDETEAAWATAYNTLSKVMIEAAYSTGEEGEAAQ